MNTLPCKERRSNDYCAIKRADSESRADLELESLFLVAFLLVQRATVRQLQRAERRFPRQADTGGILPATRIDRMVVHTGITRAAPRSADLPRIGKQEPAQGTVARCTGERQEQLGVGHQAPRAAEIIVGVDIARAELAALVAKHGTDAAVVHDLDVWYTCTAG